MLWEVVALTLAGKAGIEFPFWGSEATAEKSVLLLRRFDRGGKRLPFLSAMSMLDAKDQETTELSGVCGRFAAVRCSAQRRHACLVAADRVQRPDFEYRRPFAQSWLSIPGPAAGGYRRLRYESGTGDIKPRILSTAIDLDDSRASLELAFRPRPILS